MAGPTLLNVCHSPAGPSRLAGIASAGSLPPPLRPLPAVLPAAHPKAAWPVLLPRVHRLAGYLRFQTRPSLPVDACTFSDLKSVLDGKKLSVQLDSGGAS